jgi:hypothetical protein
MVGLQLAPDCCEAGTGKFKNCLIFFKKNSRHSLFVSGKRLDCPSQILTLTNHLNQENPRDGFPGSYATFLWLEVYVSSRIGATDH